MNIKEKLSKTTKCSSSEMLWFELQTYMKSKNKKETTASHSWCNLKAHISKHKDINMFHLTFYD